MCSFNWVAYLGLIFLALNFSQLPYLTATFSAKLYIGNKLAPEIRVSTGTKNLIRICLREIPILKPVFETNRAHTGHELRGSGGTGSHMEKCYGELCSPARRGWRRTAGGSWSGKTGGRDSRIFLPLRRQQALVSGVSQNCRGGKAPLEMVSTPGSSRVSRQQAGCLGWRPMGFGVSPQTDVFWSLSGHPVPMFGFKAGASATGSYCPAFSSTRWPRVLIFCSPLCARTVQL